MSTETIHMVKKNTLVPALRFKEFGGEWNKVTLFDLSDNVPYGMNASAIAFDGVHKYLRITDIDEETGTFKPKPLTSPDGEISDKFKLQKDDIVFTRTGASVGKPYLYNEKDGDLYYAGFLIKFSITKGDSYFIYNLTQKEAYNKWVHVYSMRSGQPGLNAEEYKALKLSIPSHPEQRKIASFLSAVDEKIQQLTKKKKLLEHYKKGVMQQLFSGKLRFKDENGKSYPDWEEKRLGEVAEIVGGGTPETIVPDYWDGEIQWFTPTEINSKFISNSKRTITQAGLNKSSAKLLPAGTILFTSRATIAELGFATQECSTNQGFQSLIVNQKNNSEFIYHLLKINKNEFVRKSQGSTFLEISSKEMKKMKFKVPVLEEQQKIALYLSSIDTKIESVNQQITQTQTFKKGLLQQMFV